MKKLILAMALLSSLSACTDPQKTESILSQNGFTDIHITGYEPWGCGENDDFHTGFTAKNPNGVVVSGVVCSSIMKFATIRFK